MWLKSTQCVVTWNKSLMKLKKFNKECHVHVLPYAGQLFKFVVVFPDYDSDITCFYIQPVTNRIMQKIQFLVYCVPTVHALDNRIHMSYTVVVIVTPFTFVQLLNNKPHPSNDRVVVARQWLTT